MTDRALSDPVAILNAHDVVFWDFDGVIKESVAVKSRGFKKLFAAYGLDVAGRVRLHHESNQGMSRFEKIPLYLAWSGLDPTEALVNEFCERFSELVKGEVIDAQWVPGVREYLETFHSRQYFALVTATPQAEIEAILRALSINGLFRTVHGAPTPKASAISEVLERVECELEDALMVGDALTDLHAADTNGIGFMLRKTHLNRELQNRYGGWQFDSLALDSERPPGF